MSSTSSAITPETEPFWTPSVPSLYRLSVPQYEAMVASGVFAKRDRIHLVGGYLVAKMTEYPPHAAACEGTRQAITSLLPDGWHVRGDKPLKIPACDSVPEPDLVVARGRWRDYERDHPGPSQVPLVVEVASTSLREDRRMARVYGAGGVAVYWIVNLADRQVEVYSDPAAEGYRSVQAFTAAEAVPLMVDGTELGRIVVRDILPWGPDEGV